MSYLDPSMTTQVEVKLWGVGDFCVHCGTSWNVSTFSNLCEQEIQRHWGTTQRVFLFQLYSQENKHKEKIYKKQKSEERMCKAEILFQLKIWSVSSMEKEKKKQAAKSS